MKVFLLCFGFLATVNAAAASQVIFSGDAQEVKVILQGPPGDTDAPNLYAALNVPVTTVKASSTKVLVISDNSGDKMLEIICRISNRVAAYGSCTVSIRKSEFSKINPQNHSASFRIMFPPHAAELGHFFHAVPGSTTLYQSQDTVFSITYKGAELGDFEILYHSR